MPKKILIVTGDAGESYEALYAKHRMAEGGRFVFSICHGIQILVAAGLAAGRKLTCYEHVKLEVTSAGGEWIGQESVRDGKFVSAQTWISHPDFYRHVMQCLEGR